MTQFCRRRSPVQAHERLPVVGRRAAVPVRLRERVAARPGVVRLGFFERGLLPRPPLLALRELVFLPFLPELPEARRLLHGIGAKQMQRRRLARKFAQTCAFFRRLVFLPYPPEARRLLHGIGAKKMQRRRLARKFAQTCAFFRRLHALPAGGDGPTGESVGL